MKKLALTVLILSMIFALASCGTKKEVITVYNSSELLIDRIVIAPEENVLESSKKIVLFDARENMDEILMPVSSRDCTVEIPTDLAESVWYMDVSASTEFFWEVATAKENFGAMFKDGKWGVHIFFDETEELLILIPLDNSDI